MSRPPPRREAEGINLIKLCISTFSSKFWQILAFFFVRDSDFSRFPSPRSFVSCWDWPFHIWQYILNCILHLMTFVGCKHFVELNKGYFSLGNALYEPCFTALQLGKLREITMEMPINARFHLLVVQNAFFSVCQRATMIEPSSICVLYD